MLTPTRCVWACMAAVAVQVFASAACAEEITWWAPDWGKARAEKLIGDFQAANPAITVKLEVTNSNGLQNRIQIVLHSGSPPDIIDSSIQWVPSYAASGKLLALDDWATKAIDVPDLLPATVESVTSDGKLYALPYRAQTLALIYNKGLYREAGLDPENPPQTWEAFLDASRKLTRKNAKGEQQYGIGVAGGGEVQNIITRLMPFMWMNGGTVISPDGKKALVNQPEAVAAVEFYAKPFTELGIAPPSTLQNDGLAMRRLFDAGTIAQYFSGQYDLAPIKQEAPNIEVGASVYPYPTGKQTAGVLSGWAFVIPAEAKHRDAALTFAAFLMRPENMGYYTDTFPASQAAMKLPRFQDPALKPFKDMLPYAKPAPSNPAWLQSVQVMYDATQSVLLKRATPQQAMDEAAKHIQELLDEQ